VPNLDMASAGESNCRCSVVRVHGQMALQWICRRAAKVSTTRGPLTAADTASAGSGCRPDCRAPLSSG
jgi:hypothetical protein